MVPKFKTKRVVMLGYLLLAIARPVEMAFFGILKQHSACVINTKTNPLIPLNTRKKIFDPLKSRLRLFLYNPFG